MTEVICKRCQYKWEYKGRKTAWTSCPNCKTSVRISFFLHKEKTEIKRLEAELEDAQGRLGKLMEFITEKNPLLMEEYSDFLIKEGQDIADKQMSAVLDELD